MDTVEEMMISSQVIMASPEMTSFLPFLQNSEEQQCDDWPDFTFPTEDLAVDLDLFSAENDNGDDDIDHLFSAYIDVRKLEEEKGPEIDDNNNNGSDGIREDGNLINGGGFVVESRGRGRRRGERRGRKEKCKDDVGIKSAPAVKKQKSCSELEVAEQGFVEPRKAMAAEDLAELWAIDPKRAKRIVANRHSAARSKERKAQYTVELEENVRNLNSQVAYLNSRLIANQKEATELAAEKEELKCQLQSMESQSERVDAQIEALQQEIEWLRSATNWEADSFQTQQPQPTYFQFPSTPMPVLQNCQQSMVAPYLHVNTQPLF